MNEKDYAMVEVGVLAVGMTIAMMLMTFYIFYGVPLATHLFFWLAGVIVLTFLLATVCHYRRHIFIMEMRHEAARHRKDFPQDRDYNEK